MLLSSMTQSTPIKNSAVERFAQLLNNHLEVDRDIQCPKNLARVHIEVKRASLRLCVEKAIWFGLPASSSSKSEETVPKHGIRVVRASLGFGELMRVTDSKSLSSINLVANLVELESASWNKTAKSNRNIEKMGYEILDLDFRNEGIDQVFLETISQVINRHNKSSMLKIKTESLLSITKNLKENLFLSVLMLKGQRAATIWTVRSKIEDVSYFISTSFKPEFAQLSPGAFLFNSVVERHKNEGYVWFDLGSGHHKYKLDIGTHLYEKRFLVTALEKSVSEKIFEKLELKK